MVNSSVFYSEIVPKFWRGKYLMKVYLCGNFSWVTIRGIGFILHTPSPRDHIDNTFSMCFFMKEIIA